jgi:hypothetical protein
MEVVDDPAAQVALVLGAALGQVGAHGLADEVVQRDAARDRLGERQ